MGRIIQIIGLAGFCLIILVANKRATPKSEFTPYQIIMWEIKANEGFRESWYKDGTKSASIGYGTNNWGNVDRKNKISKYLVNGKLTKQNATQLVKNDLSSYGKLHSDPWRNAALILYAYNRGINAAKPSNLGTCCKRKFFKNHVGCNNKNKNIRMSHNPRRKMELALWNHNFDYVDARTRQNKAKI